MKKQFVLRITALLMAMLMVLAVFAGCKKKNKDSDDVDNSPQAVFRNAITGFVTDLMQREELRPLINMTKGGSMEIKVDMDLAKMAASVGETYKGSIQGGGKFYFGDKAVLLKNLNMDLDIPDEKIDFDISGDFYMNSEYLYVTNDSVLGGTLGLIRGELKKSFQNSIFAPDSGANAEGTPADNLLKILELLDSDDLDEASAELKALAERYIKVLFDALEDNAKYAETGLNGERTITMTIDEEAIVGIVNDVYAAVKNDGELRDMIVKYGDMASDYTGMSGQDLAKAYDEALKELDSAIAELENEMTPGAIILTVTTPTDASTLRKLIVSVQEGEGDTFELQNVLTLDAGEEGARYSNRIALDIAGEMTIAYEVTQNDNDAYKASLVADDTTLFTVENNKANGAFSFAIPEADIAFGGSLKTEGDVTTLEINSITVDNETVNKGCSIALIIDESDPMPKVLNKNEIKNVFELTEGEYADLMERFEKEFEGLEGSFGNVDGGMAYPLPDGYQPYHDGDVYFAYPNGWEMSTQGNSRIFADPSGKGNNITLTRENRSKYYENFTADTFNKEIGSVLEAQGYKVISLNVDHSYCVNGTPITVVYYSLEYNGIIDQLLIGFGTGNDNVTICVTTVDGNYDIENTVRDTLYVVDMYQYQ